jgi:hypothetical protein
LSPPGKHPTRALALSSTGEHTSFQLPRSSTKISISQWSLGGIPVASKHTTLRTGQEPAQNSTTLHPASPFPLLLTTITQPSNHEVRRGSRAGVPSYKMLCPANLRHQRKLTTRGGLGDRVCPGEHALHALQTSSRTVFRCQIAGPKGKLCMH